MKRASTKGTMLTHTLDLLNPRIKPGSMLTHADYYKMRWKGSLPADNPKPKESERPDYFVAAPSVEDVVLRGIKGNFRQKMVIASLLTGDLASIPEPFRAHNISEHLAGLLASMGGPQALAGEDLPDLVQGEVEIARLSLVDSIHGEVTSLRAKRDQNDLGILLSMVDEYETEFELPKRKVSAPLTAEEVLVAFRDADPTPTVTSCQIEFSSFFYPTLDALASETGIKPAAD